MIPAHADVSFFVEAGTKASLHVVWNKTAARAHEGTVGKFPPVLLIPENDLSKSENLVVKKINSADERANVEQKHYRTLNAKICYYCRKRESGKRSTNTSNIQVLQKSFESTEFNLAAVNDFFGRRLYFSGIQNNL